MKKNALEKTAKPFVFKDTLLNSKEYIDMGSSGNGLNRRSDILRDMRVWPADQIKLLDGIFTLTENEDLAPFNPVNEDVSLIYRNIYRLFGGWIGVKIAATGFLELDLAERVLGIVFRKYNSKKGGDLPNNLHLLLIAFSLGVGAAKMLEAGEEINYKFSRIDKQLWGDSEDEDDINNCDDFLNGLRS